MNQKVIMDKDLNNLKRPHKRLVDFLIVLIFIFWVVIFENDKIVQGTKTE